MDSILLHGIKTHNLKNLDIQLPHGKLYVVTGVSGSGKSSLAFDTLYAEGQRRYVESLSAYARQFLQRMEKPDVESVSGIPPAIAIQAKNVVTNARSTVGTQTEINDYLRVLFTRIGKTICPDCNLEAKSHNPSEASQYLLQSFKDEKVDILFKATLGSKGKKYVREAVEEMVRQGFLFFYVGDEKKTGEELLENVPVGLTEIWVGVDSLKLKAQREKRIVDSMEMAFKYGHGEARVRINDADYFFSESRQCLKCQKKFRKPSANLFSFNSPLGACEECQGFGRVITLDWDLVVPDKNKSLYDGAIEPWTKPSTSWEFQQLLKFCRSKKIPTHKPWKDLSKKQQDYVLTGEEGSKFHSVQDFFKYLESKTYKMHVRIFLSKYRRFIPCTKCQESRLKEEALWVKLKKHHIFELQQMSILDLYQFMDQFKFTEDEKAKTEPVYLEIMNRVKFLKEVGLGYLSLARLSRTLSGGEVQRIHLASSLGSSLVDTLYVLDEPSIGLHERDNRMLISLLKDLRNLGNTVVVVEHDKAMIEAADEVLDMGPRGGENGGELIHQGNIESLLTNKQSLTGLYLSGDKEISRSLTNRVGSKKAINIKSARQHNLKGVNVSIPLNQLVVLTGVSGSGKSTLMYEILYGHYQRHRGRPIQDLGAVKSITGFKNIDEMVLVDQTPIGRTPRSNPVTYIKAFDDIRKIFAATQDAKHLGFQVGDFSFNVDGGRCERCKGDGKIKVEMHFLADVYITCERCQGTRYKESILEVKYRDKNIDDVLSMTIDESVSFFRDYPKLVEKLERLTKVGLGYLRLGQPATTLSGGEAQRLKLAVEMVSRKSGHVLFLFDEPTTGLHYADIRYLMDAFESLLEYGHSLLVIEHNMEVIRNADYVIDLGPEGGSLGGEVLFQGTVPDLLTVPNSFTGKCLKEYDSPRVLAHS